MRSIYFACLAIMALYSAPVSGDELKSGPEKRIGGSFIVEAITGGNKGKSLCYV
jgi:hypothetical protein